MKRIVSRDNARFKQLRRWASHGRARRDDGVVLLDGLHLVEALLDAGGTLAEVVVSPSGLARAEIADWLAQQPRLAAVELPDTLFAEIACTDTPSGLLAVGRVAAPPLAAADSDCLILDGVQDPGNVGTLLRTAAAAGLHRALLGPGCADAWAPKTLRAGQGAQFQLAVHESVDLPRFLGNYCGHSIVTALDAAQTLWEAPLDGPLAWIVGAEGQGVSAPVRAAATLALRIPMPGPTESLNVAAAAAVCLFEAVRRRRA